MDRGEIIDASPENPVLVILGCDVEGCLRGCFADAHELLRELVRQGWRRGENPEGQGIDICPSCVVKIREAQSDA